MWTWWRARRGSLSRPAAPWWTTSRPPFLGRRTSRQHWQPSPPCRDWQASFGCADWWRHSLLPRLVAGHVGGEALPAGRCGLHRASVPLDQGGHHANKQPPDGRRGPQEEGRQVGGGDDDQVGQSSLCPDLGQSHCRLLPGHLLDKEKSLSSLVFIPSRKL